MYTNKIHKENREVTRRKSKSDAVVKHQRTFVVIKNASNVKGLLRAVLATLPLFSDFPGEDDIIHEEKITYTYWHCNTKIREIYVAKKNFILPNTSYVNIIYQ